MTSWPLQNGKRRHTRCGMRPGKGLASWPSQVHLRAKKQSSPKQRPKSTYRIGHTQIKAENPTSRSGTPRYRGAAHPLCFTDEVLEHEFPEGFKPVNIEAYDGTTNPGVWIEDYIIHIHMARGDDLHAIKYLPLKLKGPARHWLKSLPENTIKSWEELEDAFRANFQGTYVRPPDADDLSHITQQSGESARQFWNRFLTKKNQIVDCLDAEALAAFRHNVRDEWLARHLGQEKPRTMAALTSCMTRFCAGEDSWLARCSTSDPSTSETRDGNRKPRRNKDRRWTKEKSPKSTTVNARFKSSRQNQTKPPLQDNRDDPSNLNKILDRICQIHSTPGKPANHTHRDCWVFKQFGRLNAEHKGLDTPSEDEDEPQKQSTRKQKNFPQEVKIVNLLHITKRAAPIKVCATWPIPKGSRHWLLKPIIFD